MKIAGFWVKIFTTSLMLLSFVHFLRQFLFLCDETWNSWSSSKPHGPGGYTSLPFTHPNPKQNPTILPPVCGLFLFPVIKFVVCACASARDMVPHKVGNLWPLEKVGSKIHLALLKKLVALPETNIFPPKKKAETQKERIISQPPISRW